ncbi:MAG TPA: hypothetical protein VMP01_11095 [Pirellulaceae bacterium]|nr:hypothetical protein [Pirellulaceae bacterium]
MMELTTREQATAVRLGEALAQFLVALEEGAAARQAKRLLKDSPPSRDRSTTSEPQSGKEPPAMKATPTTIPIQPTIGIGRAEPERLLVGSREAAKLLSISTRCLWGMTAPRGPLPAVYMGRRVLYAVADLAAAVEKLTKRQR